MERDFKQWLALFRTSIANYQYYTYFDKVFSNVDAIKVELNIMNSLIGSKNIENDFDNLYPWSDIITYNYDTKNKKITAFYGEPGFNRSYR